MQAASATFPRANLIAAMAAIAACDIALGLTFQLLPLLMENGGWPAWIIGVNTAMGPIGLLMVGPFLPRLLGHIGTRQAAIGLVGLIALLLLAMSLTPVWLWFPLRLLFGMCTGALFTISETWILSFATDENRGRVMGIYTSILAVTFAIGPLILPWTGILGWLPWAIGILCVIIATLPLTFVRVDQQAFKPKDEGGGFFAFVKKAPLLLFAIWTVTLFDSVLISFFTIYGIRNGLPLEEASRLLGFGIIGNVVLFYPIGWLADHWSRKGVMLVSAVATIVLTLCLIPLIHHWLVFPLMVVLTGAAFGVYVVALATLGDSFKGPDLLAGSAATAAMWGLGGLIGPPIAGAAIDLFGINALPVTLAGFYVLLLAGLVISGGKLVAEPTHG